MALTLLIGGARSGKTTFAVQAGLRYAASARDAQGGRVTYLATAPRSDADMSLRIDRHQAERPGDWHTIEEQFDVAPAIASVRAGMIIVDCLTLWTTNLMLSDATDSVIAEQADDAIAAAVEHVGPVVVVTNEVGLGIVPSNHLARRFRDIHGLVNQRWARAAQSTLNLVAGRVVPLEDPSAHLDRVIL